MNRQPLVSILIPVFNREKLVVDALDSALAQAYPNIEVVVVDNFSTDGTFNIVQRYAQHDSRIRCWRNNENLGAVKNWIKCFEYSSGDYIKFLFSDDWLEADAVERYLTPLLEYSDAGFSYSTAEIHFASAVVRDYEQKQTGLMSSFDFLRATLTGTPPVPVSPGCALFRRKDVAQGLDSNLPNRLGLACSHKGIGPDMLLFLRTCDAYPNVYYLAEGLSHFRGHPDSITISNSRHLVSLCYEAAFGWFLATSKLPARERRIFNALLFIRILHPAQLRLTGQVNPWQVYAGLFPEGYRYWDIAFLSPEAIDLICSRVTRRLLRPPTDAS